jgi:hypothetical protein
MTPPPDYLDHVYLALMVMSRTVLSKDPQATIAPMAIAIKDDLTQSLPVLLRPMEKRVSILQQIAQSDPTIQTIVFVYDGFVTTLDKNQQVDRPRQDAIIIMTFHRDVPFAIDTHTLRYSRNETGVVTIEPVEIHTLTPESSPDSHYWGLWSTRKEDECPISPSNSGDTPDLV